jgi:hypothetical protein
MLASMLTQLSMRSDPGAMYIFNSGLPAYVNKEDRAYIDPQSQGPHHQLRTQRARLHREPHGL